MEFNEQHKLVNKNAYRDRTMEQIVKTQREDSGGKVGKKSAKGLVCMSISLTNGHRQQGNEGMSGGKGSGGISTHM